MTHTFWLSYASSSDSKVILGVLCTLWSAHFGHISGPPPLSTDRLAHRPVGGRTVLFFFGKRPVGGQGGGGIRIWSNLDLNGR